MTTLRLRVSFSRFKVELLKNGIFETTEQPRSETLSYVEGNYNPIRLHSSLGYKGLREFQLDLKTKN